MKDIWDYLSISIVLTIPLAIGLFHGIKGHVNLPYSFLFGQKEISLPKTSISIAALSAGPVVLFLLPAYQFDFGFTWVLAGAGYLLALAIVTVFVVPILHYGRSPSIFQYIEERYRSTALRYMCIVVFILGTVVYNSALLSLCSQLLAGIIPIQNWMLALLLGTLITFSVVTGGLGATTDLNTVLLPLCGATALGTMLGMGYSNPTVRGAGENGKLFEFNLELDFFNDLPSVWTVIPFSFVVSLHVLGTGQSLYQSFAPAVTKRRARLGLVLSAPLLLIIVGLAVLVGLLVRKSLDACRQLDMDVQDNAMQNVLVAIQLWFEGIPAVAGFIVGGLSCFGICVLSTSALNLATVVWEEILCNHLRLKKDKRQVLAIQLLITMYVFLLTGGTVALLLTIVDFWKFYQTLFLVTSSVLSPVTAIFLTGMFFPCCNRRGALMAFLLGSILTLTFGVGNLYFRDTLHPIYVPVDSSCSISVTTLSSRLNSTYSTSVFPSTSTPTPTKLLLTTPGPNISDMTTLSRSQPVTTYTLPGFSPLAETTTSVSTTTSKVKTTQRALPLPVINSSSSITISRGGPNTQNNSDITTPMLTTTEATTTTTTPTLTSTSTSTPVVAEISKSREVFQLAETEETFPETDEAMENLTEILTQQLRALKQKQFISINPSVPAVYFLPRAANERNDAQVDPIRLGTQPELIPVQNRQQVSPNNRRHQQTVLYYGEPAQQHMVDTRDKSNQSQNTTPSDSTPKRRNQSRDQIDQGMKIGDGMVTSYANETDNGSRTEKVLSLIFRTTLLLHPVIGFVFTAVCTLLLSICTGGQDIYALDWNLVYWTCNDCTQRLTFGKNTTLRRRKPRGGKTPYVASESFRYARHGPLPDSNYRNPRVSQINMTSSQTKIETDFDY